MPCPYIVALTNIVHELMSFIMGQWAYNHGETKPKFRINVALNKCAETFRIGRVAYKTVAYRLPENRRAHIFLNLRSVCGRPIEFGSFKCCVPIFCCWSEEPTLQFVQISGLYAWYVDKMAPVAWDVGVIQSESRVV